MLSNDFIGLPRCLSNDFIGLPKCLSDFQIYLDMDGVIANFIDTYMNLVDVTGIEFKGCRSDNRNNPELFRVAVMEYQIFKDLPLMPFASELISHLTELQHKTGLKIELLSSVNSHYDDIATFAASQKRAWLNHNKITWKANFVRTNEAKSFFASSKSLLIDDMPHCTDPFKGCGGHVIQYMGFDDNFRLELNNKLHLMYESDKNASLEIN